MLPQNTDYTSTSLNKCVFVLLEIQSETPMYFVNNNEPVTFGGHTYQNLPFNINGISESSKGEIPKIDVAVSNITNLIAGIIDTDLDDVPVKIYVVREGETTEDLSFNFVINNVSYDAEWLSLSLGAPISFVSNFPKGKYVQCCPFLFKGWRCRYSGSQTSCDHTFKTCKNTMHNQSRFGGFTNNVS